MQRKSNFMQVVIPQKGSTRKREASFTSSKPDPNKRWAEWMKVTLVTFKLGKNNRFKKVSVTNKLKTKTRKTNYSRSKKRVYKTSRRKYARR
jgi:hypothetical protein